MPPAHSGHNGFAEWGPPSRATDTIVLVGEFGDEEVRAWFTRCRVAATLDDTVDNEESGAPVRVCTDPREPWPSPWQEMRHLS